MHPTFLHITDLFPTSFFVPSNSLTCPNPTHLINTPCVPYNLLTCLTSLMACLYTHPSASGFNTIISCAPLRRMHLPLLHASMSLFACPTCICSPLHASMYFLVCIPTPFCHVHPHLSVTCIHTFSLHTSMLFVTCIHPFHHVHPCPFNPSCPCISNNLLPPTYTLCSSTV